MRAITFKVESRFGNYRARGTVYETRTGSHPSLTRYYVRDVESLTPGVTIGGRRLGIVKPEQVEVSQ